MTFDPHTGRAVVTGGSYAPDQLFEAMLQGGSVRNNPSSLKEFTNRLLNQPGNPGLPQLTSDLANRLIFRLTKGQGMHQFNRGAMTSAPPTVLPGGLKVQSRAAPNSAGYEYAVTTPEGHQITLPGGTWAGNSGNLFQDLIPYVSDKAKARYRSEAEAISPLLIELLGRQALGR